jgi:hypothetical protein
MMDLEVAGVIVVVCTELLEGNSFTYFLIYLFIV